MVKVVTGKDFPFKFGLYMQDRYIFAQDRVRFVGEQVAAVIACDPKTAAARRGLGQGGIRTAAPRLRPGPGRSEKSAPLLHPELGGYQHVPWFFPKPKTNIAHWRKIRKGDTAKGFERSRCHPRRHLHACRATPTAPSSRTP